MIIDIIYYNGTLMNDSDKYIDMPKSFNGNIIVIVILQYNRKKNLNNNYSIVQY